MKKLVFIILISACTLAAGCKKQQFLIPENAFTTFEVEDIQSDAAWADIIPANNDFYYYFDYMPKSEWSRFAPEEWVEKTDREARELYERIKTKDLGSFQDVCLYKDAYFSPITGLEPDTEYCAFAYPYDWDIMPVKQVTTFMFKTPKAVVSDIKFTVVLTGSILTMIPSNEDKYFWIYDSKENMEKEAGGDAESYYRLLVRKFWEYNLFPDALSVGPEIEDITKYFNLKDGDQFYVMASGYDQGITSDIFVELVTYTE